MLMGNNPIPQIVNSRNRSIANITRPGHTFHEGRVDLTITPTGANTSRLDIVGTGVGAEPLVNEIAGHLIFGYTAAYLVEACSGEARLG